MALTITKLKMWKDPGYTRGCLEVPPAGSKLLPGTPDYTLPADQTLRPHPGSTLTELHLPLSFTQTFGMSYLYIEATDGGGSVSLFGWITSIEQRSTAAEGITLKWDVDWWRSYSGDAVFGSATIKRCNDSGYKRPYPITPRKWKVKHFEKLMTFKEYPYDTDTYPYCIIVSANITQTINGASVTRTAILFWVCNESAGESITDVDTSTTYKTPSLGDVMSGMIDERLGLAPTQINSISISPTPVTPAGAMASVSGGGMLPPHTSGVDNYSCYVNIHGHVTPPAYFVHYNNTYTTDDMQKCIVVDPIGSVIATLPWGFEIDTGYVGIDAGTTTAYMTGSFSKLGDYESTISILTTGKGFTAPLMSAPMNSNGYSEYAYSGQRDYDLRVRELQRTEQLTNGILNTSSSMLGGGIGGAMAGGAKGAGAGALIGGGVNLVQTYVEYDTGKMYDAAYQNAEDKKASNQLSTMLLPAGGFSWCSASLGLKTWYIVQLEADTVSAQEYSDNVSINGYEVDIPVSSASSYITTGGPLQMDNIVITGNIPPQAKQYMINKLQNGIHIVEKNPSGVAP